MVNQGNKYFNNEVCCVYISCRQRNHSMAKKPEFIQARSSFRETAVNGSRVPANRRHRFHQTQFK